jgi:hypothetical protein
VILLSIAYSLINYSKNSILKSNEYSLGKKQTSYDDLLDSILNQVCSNEINKI